MKMSGRWISRSMINKIMTGVVLAAMLGSTAIVPAFGDDDHNRRERRERGRYEHREREHHHGRFVHRRVYIERERVYAPPPVIYAPQPEPGINIFIPIR